MFNFFFSFFKLSSGIFGYNGWDFHHEDEVGMQELFPISETEMLLNEPFYYPPLDFSHTLVPGNYYLYIYVTLFHDLIIFFFFFCRGFVVQF